MTFNRAGDRQLAGIDFSGALARLASSVGNAAAASAKAKVLEQTAAFYRLLDRINTQSARVATIGSVRTTLSPADQAKLVAAENAVRAARSQWSSTSDQLNAVNAQLSANNTGALTSSVPKLLANVVLSQQLVDGVDRALNSINAPAAGLQLSTSGKVGLTLGTIAIAAGLAWFFGRRH